MYSEIGFRADAQEEYKSRFAPHMDCFRWVDEHNQVPLADPPAWLTLHVCFDLFHFGPAAGSSATPICPWEVMA